MRTTILSIVVLAVSLGAPAQDPSLASLPLVQEFHSGEKINYDFEGTFSITPDRNEGTGFELGGMPKDCSYSLKSVASVSIGDTTPIVKGTVRFANLRITRSSCDQHVRREVETILGQSAGEVPFEIRRNGEVVFTARKGSDDDPAPETAGVLLPVKAAWDVLQTAIAETSVPGSGWRPSNAFVYLRDSFLRDMNVAAHNANYSANVSVGNLRCGRVSFRQVFEPAEIPIYTERRTNADDFHGVDIIAGTARISLLFDLAQRRIVYLTRDREVNDHVRIHRRDSDADDDVSLGAIKIEEHSVVRLIPDRDPEGWLAALNAFEEGTVPAAPVASTEDSPLVAAAAEARRRRAAAAPVIDDPAQLDPVPPGFHRENRKDCLSACFTITFALPDASRRASQDASTSLFLAPVGNQSVSIAVGPVTPDKFAGLREEELLRRETDRYLANQLWYAASSGIPKSISFVDLGDRPAQITEFSATGRSSKPVKGMVALVSLPWDHVTKVACIYPEDAAPGTDALCRTILESIRVH